ncbi:phosphodiester glycosidase family protein [Paenibacillus sp. JX-17]|uniref:Phosphodiester glycosidase family protein n=1 Tax=Paenibacillus lacisoli TaxID=3064525 RepID=A0ABT9CBR1_9BACL|nr:phosphodiester glycosidase family protein [Paenibacillus sp. JX-17]MDO7905053.1 phosphodiester glycosidase family protein [Paenibacillus sp. JX-17]
MKKIFTLVLLAALAMVMPVYASAPAKMIVLTDKAGASFVPLSLLKSYQGVSVTWNESQKKAEIIKNGTTLSLVAGSTSAWVNDKKMTLTSSAFRENGTTYVPLQFIAQQLGFQAKWNNNTSSVLLTAGKDSMTLPVTARGSISTSTKPVTAAKKTFNVGGRSFSAQVVTISMLDPRVQLDVALAGNQVGKVEDLRSIAKRNQAVVAINGTFFDAYTKGSIKTPYGYIVSSGKILKPSPADKRVIFTYDSNQLAQLIPGLSFNSFYDTGEIQGALQAGPRLVANGQVALDVKGEGFRDPKILTGGGARSALGITKDHKLILLTTGGATIPQLAQIMKQAGAYQAMNLDGGASSGLYYNGSYLTSPGRQISNALIVKLVN